MNSWKTRLVTSKFALFACAVLLLSAAAFALPPQKDKKDAGSKGQKTIKLHIIVTGGEKDSPVANASVYVRFSEESGLIRKKEKLAEMNLKTNQEGSVKVPPVPRGKVLIQVIAPGWKTYGQWYTLDKDEDMIKIKLERPPKWY